MKKIGIVGGIGWQSTAVYYSQLFRRSEQVHCDKGLRGTPAMPEISIESLDLAKAMAYLGSDGNEQSWMQFDSYHHAALCRLQMSGAEVALIASNTPHHRFDSIVQGIQIPVINIVQEMAKECARIEARHVLLLGTDLTMRSNKFREEFARWGIEANGPRDEDLRKMILELIADLQRSTSKAAAERLIRIVRCTLRETKFKHRPTVCLACTELPLAFEKMITSRNFEYHHIRFINSVAVHVDSTFNFACAG